MVVDMDEGREDELREWIDRAVGRVYEVTEGDREGKVFRVEKSYISYETIEGIETQQRNFSYEWVDAHTEEVEVAHGVATITIAGGRASAGSESVGDHKNKVSAGIYEEVN